MAILRTPFFLIGGFMNQYFNLYIESETENSTIFYTTDGSKPTQASNIYNNYILINENLLNSGTTTADEYGIAYSPTYDGIVIRAFAAARIMFKVILSLTAISLVSSMITFQQFLLQSSRRYVGSKYWNACWRK